jgi:hypothetical protein
VKAFQTLVRSSALLCATLLAIVPSFSQAAQSYVNQTVEYQTAMRPINTLDYPVTGRLEIRTNSDGIITGYYRPADNNSFIPVNGGVDGKYVWLDIGRSGATRVNGTYQNGEIVGSAMTSQGIVEFSARAPRVENSGS